MVSLEEALRIVEERDREAESEAWAVPASVTATDPSGAITVVLGATGRPESFTVSSNWLRTLGSESFGGAVAEAVRAARARRGELFEEAMKRGPGEKQRRSERPPPAAPDREMLVVARPFSVMLADVITLMGVATGERGDAPGDGNAVAGFGKLALTVRPDGSVHCQADPRWVVTRDGAELTDELNRLLDAASEGMSGPAGRLGGMVDQLRMEALATGFGGALYIRLKAGPSMPEEGR